MHLKETNQQTKQLCRLLASAPVCWAGCLTDSCRFLYPVWNFGLQPSAQKVDQLLPQLWLSNLLKDVNYHILPPSIIEFLIKNHYPALLLVSTDEGLVLPANQVTFGWTLGTVTGLTGLGSSCPWQSYFLLGWILQDACQSMIPPTYPPSSSTIPLTYHHNLHNRQLVIGQSSVWMPILLNSLSQFIVLDGTFANKCNRFSMLFAYISWNSGESKVTRTCKPPKQNFLLLLSLMLLQTSNCPTQY